MTTPTYLVTFDVVFDSALTIGRTLLTNRRSACAAKRAESCDRPNARAIAVLGVTRYPFPSHSRANHL